MFFHVAIHEAGHAVVLRATLGLQPPRRAVDLGEPEPKAWSDFARGLLEEGRDPTLVTAFLLGGVEALTRAVETSTVRSSRFHGLNGPDGQDSDGELVDVAVLSYGADRWSASDMARQVVAHDWATVISISGVLAATGEIDPDELQPLLARVTPI